jgi:hypothetical protein
VTAFRSNLPEDAPRQVRDWVAPDGPAYTVTLEPIRQLFESHDRRRILTFRNRLDSAVIERVQLVPEDFDLESASDSTLTTLLHLR